MSKIEWTDKTWNPVIGCTKCSPGCDNCYAEQMSFRLWHMGQDIYGNVITGIWNSHRSFCWNGNVVCREDVLEKPLRWKKPRKIFVCSMGDLFHEKVRFSFIDEAREVMEQCSRHTFLVLTKRPQQILNYLYTGPPDKDNFDTINRVRLFPDNVWLGISIENQMLWADRIVPFEKISSTKKFISFEPLLSEMPISPSTLIENRIDWVIVGCESGPKRRPCKIEWIMYLAEVCGEAGVPIFIKQLSINGKVSRNPAEWPKDLRIREWPRGIR